MDYPIVPLPASQFRRRLERIVDVYIEAMNYDPQVKARRVSHWTSLSRTPGFTCFAAFDPDRPSTSPVAGTSGVTAQELVGFIYGVPGTRRQWWNVQVRSSMAMAGMPAPVSAAILSNYMELSELHVDPHYQGHGIGQSLLTAFSRAIPHTKILLSTPEVPNEDNRAFRLYRRAGFIDIVRYMHFAGDPRPFAILGLPLEPENDPYAEAIPPQINH